MPGLLKVNGCLARVNGLQSQGQRPDYSRSTKGRIAKREEEIYRGASGRYTSIDRYRERAERLSFFFFFFFFRRIHPKKNQLLVLKINEESERQKRIQLGEHIVIREFENFRRYRKDVNEIDEEFVQNR